MNEEPRHFVSVCNETPPGLFAAGQIRALLLVKSGNISLVTQCVIHCSQMQELEKV